MIRSQPILPLRFYNDLFDQDRFNKFHHGELKSLLHYPVNGIPNFQIFRNRSLAAPTRFIMRNICSDAQANFYRLVPEGSFSDYTKFTDYFGTGLTTFATYDDGVNPPDFRSVTLGKIDCNKLKGVQYSSEYSDPLSDTPKIELPILTGQRYLFKMLVDKLNKNGGSFKITIYDGDNTGILLKTVIAQEVVILNFLASSNVITIYFEDYNINSDEFEISEIQNVVYPTDYLSFLTDIQLSTALFSSNMIDTPDGDIVVLCYPAQNNYIEPGEYYYIVEFGLETYYSEVFSIKSLKDIENYYKLTWWNDCDLNGIIYDSEKLGFCQYKNTLYLEAALFKPEYDTSVETVQDGENTLIPTFKKWQKGLSLDIAKANEFLADALTGIFLHDNKFIKEPINHKQLLVFNEYPILEVESDVQSVLEDSFQKVVMKFLLSKFYTKANCCDEVEEVDCEVCTYQASSNPMLSDYILILTEPSDPDDGLYNISGDSVLVEVQPDDIICNLDDDKYYKLGLVAGNYIATLVAPKVNSTTNTGLGYLLVNCGVVPNTFGELEYFTDIVGWVTGGNVLAGESGIISIPFNLSYSVGASSIKFRVKSRTRGCDYGVSDEYVYL